MGSIFKQDSAEQKDKPIECWYKSPKGNFCIRSPSPVACKEEDGKYKTYPECNDVIRATATPKPKVRTSF